MKLSILASVFLLLFTSNLFSKTLPQVFYEVSPNLQNNDVKLKIKLSFKGDKSGVTKVKLPSEFAGQFELFKAVQNLKIVNGNAKLIDTEKPEIKKITHLPNEKITVEYELIQDWQGNPNAGSASQNQGSGYRPTIKKDYFHILGNGFWILPDSDENTKLLVSITWKDFPIDWKLANSFGANQNRQIFRTDAGSLMSSVFVGGDFKLKPKLVKGKPVWTAIRGKWNFTDEEFTNLTEKIIASEREFFKDFNHPYYLVTALPLEDDKSSLSFGGTGLTNSFATFMTTNAQIENVASLLAHEYFHNWNTISFGGMKQPEALIYWFSEGFTDYYTYQLLFRSGLMSAENYVAQYNLFANEYYLSEVRNADNQRVLADFFKSYEVSKLPYRRGFFLATKWNQIIRQQSNGKKSLDDVMRNILQDKRHGKIKELSKEYLLSLFSKFANYDFELDIEKYIEKGETIDNLNGVLGNCVANSELSLGKYELGFDDISLQNKVISGVTENNAAYENGLRNGQKLLGASVYFGNASKQVEIVIEENGKPKKITYLPQSKSKVNVPHFKLKEYLSNEEKKSCLDTASR